jgi:predicted aldo/keto reductase-like oxidoreductase
MRYRSFKETGNSISQLGFGTMRLPLVGNDAGEIDEQKAIEMIRDAIDRGINYIDTAYMYHKGNSEIVVGKALQDGYRERILLADKMPVWMANSTAEMQAIFDDQLKKVDVDYFDFYLVHNVNRTFWKKVEAYKVLEFLEEKRSEGKIRYIGFSFHDDFDFFKEIIDIYPWDFCQIQLNFMDINFQAGIEGLKLAGEKNIPVIIMEPLKGGKLTDAVPQSIEELWRTAPIQRKPADWGLRWVADFPQVLTILSGMSLQEHIDQNIEVLSDAAAGTLTVIEKQVIQDVSDEYNRLIRASCTNCKYCLPCPMGINIPNTLAHLNNWYLYDNNKKTLGEFMFNNAQHMPSTCIDCKVCESKCPQQLPISDLMKEMAVIFG